VTTPTSTQERALQVRRTYRRGVVRSIAKSAGSGLIATAVIIGLWAGSLKLFDIQSFVGKTPLDVWTYLFIAPTASENRDFVGEQLGQTLVDSAIGFIAGLAGALIIASIFILARRVEHALLPIALLLQTVPLIAMAPIIILIFGRDTATVAVMGGLVVLFPALVTIVFGLRSASPAMLDLITVYGGTKVTSLVKIAIPSALPALFAAIKISVPGAITGALIAEWLATGQGIGRAVVSAIGQAKMNEVWALGVVITAISIALYMIVGLIESLVLARMGVKQTSLT
jgi:ABC-type nitrate/sulfonate/bicarbonate transport system permease component